MLTSERPLFRRGKSKDPASQCYCLITGMLNRIWIQEAAADCEQKKQLFRAGYFARDPR